MSKASTSTDILPPILYGLRKTHKAVEDPVVGPKVRPVCAANVAPNSRLSHFLSMIVNDFMDAENYEGEVRSSEEMRALFEAYNEAVQANDANNDNDATDDVSQFPILLGRVSNPFNSFQQSNHHHLWPSFLILVEE